MIRRSPAECYIKYLLVHPEGYTDEDVVRTLREHHLDHPGGSYLSRLRSKLHPPNPFYPMNGSHSPSFKFLVGERVHTLFFPDSKTKAALDVLTTPRVKELVESMTIVHDPLPLVAARIKRAGLGQYSEGDLKRYCHYFWNLDLVDALELRALVSKRVDDMLTDGNDPANLVLYKNMKKSMYGDPRYMAASDPTSVLSAVRLQVRFGYMPSRVDLVRLAEMGTALAAIGATHSALNGGAHAAQDARDYAMAAERLYALRQSLGTPDETLMKDLRQMAIHTSSEPVQHIDALSSGSYTDYSNLMLAAGTEVDEDE